MIQINIANIVDIPLLHQLGKESFFPTYLPFISEVQVKYMFEMMYSFDALATQMQERGDVFLIAYQDNKAIGFAAFQKDYYLGTTKLHKLYVLPNIQTNGVGKALLLRVEQLANAASQKSLILNVNRYNKALGFYQHLGFSIVKEKDIDIGGGFFMNDYEMKKSLA